MRSRISLLVFVLALHAGMRPAAAQEAANAPSVHPIPPRVGVGVTETRLTLQGAVEMAAKNNLDVQIERTNVANANQAIKAAQGAFDPVLRFSPGWESATTPVSSVLQAADGRLVSKSWLSNVTLVQPLTVLGTRFNAGGDNSRIQTNSPFNTLNPYYGSRLVIGVAQPLLRGLRTDASRTLVTVRGRELNVAELGLQLQLINIVAQVEQAYWDLVAARQDVEVKQEAVNLGQQQFEINQRFVKAGTLAQVELSASEAELERRRDDLYTSVANLTTVENRLKALLAPDLTSDLWRDQIVPVETSRPVNVPPIPDVDALIDQALKSRLELRQIATRGEIAEVQKKFAADQKKPQVDVVAAFVNTGLAGSVRTGDNPLTASNVALYQRLNLLSAQAGLGPVPAPSIGGLPQELVGSNGTSWSNLMSGRYQTFQVGLNIDLNFRNRTAEANFAQAEIAERRLGLERSRTQQAIGQQVRDSLQTIESARQRVAAAEVSARAAREKLESETRMFQAGESTNFLVLTRQNEYSNSRLRAIVANLDLNRALARLEVAVGSTLNTYGLRP